MHGYLQAIYGALMSIENALRIVKDNRTTKRATQETAEKVVAVWTKWRNGYEFSAFEKEQMETYRARRSLGRERSLKDRRAILGYYFLSALRECLEKPDKWRQPADDDVRIFQGRLIAWTSAQRDR